MGDAAGHTKPITGGGISYGMISAEYLAESIIQDNLPAYDRLWKKRFGRELRFGLYIRKVMGLLDDRTHYEIFQQLASVADHVSRYSDFDSHHSVWRVLFSDPRFYFRLAKWYGRLLQKRFQFRWGLAHLKKVGKVL